MLSPFWVVLFYFTLIMLGIAQALALFHSVIQVIFFHVLTIDIMKKMMMKIDISYHGLALFHSVIQVIYFLLLI